MAEVKRVKRTCELENKRINSLRELNDFKEEIREERVGNQKRAGVRITTAMGSCGIAVGAQEILEAISDELTTRGLEDISIHNTGCIGLCEQEPLVKIKIEDQPAVFYGNLTPELAREVVKNHIVDNQIIASC
ncbi:(2Fe-2S) ferredoxin domain-containing protein [Natroniella sulfidigena]|uniref:(2Fe-2S) ferredoxin domain-containing protein n=1 Tax=Natroniella sulfidigena TaxID=723921 RepID=UPI00200A2ED3|nr:(2Fe-2S) ferredoxin domain-containing protein [Natroniella sulfidigena]MCK8816625.1 (2Fe-2S) ferredoxin domain-containing protein [Natroniella sulfidigena]